MASQYVLQTAARFSLSFSSVAAGPVRATLNAANTKTTYGVDAEILEGNGRPVILTKLQKQ